jgi:hypothetical protein
VEFAMTAPILMFLLVGVAQVGVLYFTQIAVATAAREGARIAAENPGNTTLFANPASPGPPVNCSGSSIYACQAIYNSTHNGNYGGLIDPTQFLGVTLTGSVYPGSSPVQCVSARGTSDGVVTVAVSYRAPVFIPLLNGIFSDQGQNYRTVSTTVSVRVEPCESTNGN